MTNAYCYVLFYASLNVDVWRLACASVMCANYCPLGYCYVLWSKDNYSVVWLITTWNKMITLINNTENNKCYTQNVLVYHCFQRSISARFITITFQALTSFNMPVFNILNIINIHRTGTQSTSTGSPYLRPQKPAKQNQHNGFRITHRHNRYISKSLISQWIIILAIQIHIQNTLFKTYVIQDILFKAVQNTATNTNTYSSTRKYQAATVQFHDTNPRTNELRL